MTVDTCVLDEQRLLRLTLYVSGIFVLMALGFALLTGSDAILFDGVYLLMSFFMALLTVKVANFVERPGDERFHLGYSAMEPTLNLFKSLIIIVVCVFAVIGAINRLAAGGNSTEYGRGDQSRSIRERNK